jgi:predicted amidophosphoribosyltransferase
LGGTRAVIQLIVLRRFLNRFKGRSVLLIDDVVTTCATIDECAKILKTKAKAQEVNALVLARNTQSRDDSNE